MLWQATVLYSHPTECHIQGDTEQTGEGSRFVVDFFLFFVCWWFTFMFVYVALVWTQLGQRCHFLLTEQEPLCIGPLSEGQHTNTDFIMAFMQRSVYLQLSENQHPIWPKRSPGLCVFQSARMWEMCVHILHLHPGRWVVLLHGDYA